MPASTESTPLIKINTDRNRNEYCVNKNVDEEKGISLHDQQSNDAPEKNNGAHPSTPTPTSSTTTATATKSQSLSPENPTWSEAFQYISPYLRPRDRRHSLLAFFALLTVLLEKLVNILPPLAIRHAVDAISDYASNSNESTARNDYNNDTDTTNPQQQTATAVATTISLSILTYFLLTTLSSLLSSLQSIAQRSVSLDAERRFATALFSHLQLLGPAYHLSKHAGELLRILSRGSDATSTIIDSLWFNLLPSLFEAMVVGTVFWKLLGIPSIAVSTIGSVVVYLTYTLMVTNTRIAQRRKVLEKSEDVGRIETETLVNYETVVMFGRERKEVVEYDGVRREYMEERVNMLGLFAWLQLGQQTIRLAGTCLGLWLAGRATVYGTSSGGDGGTGDGSNNGMLSPGSFVIVQLYIQQLFQPLSYLGFTYRQISEAFTDLEKAVKMMRHEPMVKDAEDAVEWDVALQQKITQTTKNNEQHTAAATTTTTTATDHSGDIKFENVSFRYKVKSHRKTLGGPDVMEDGTSSSGGGRGGGKRGRGGFRKGMWGNRGRGVWSGNGGGNFWMKDVPKTSSKDGNHDEMAEDVKVGGIDNVSFHIPAGQTAALVGPSGSGKTTIVRLILRMYDSDEGSVMVDDINVKALLQQSLRSSIGVVAQDTILFHASLRDNITYGKEDATEEEVWDAVRISALEPLVKSLPEGLDTLVGERGMKLSGGERQRVGLARCIIKQPKLVLLDEATSALDSGTEREIQRNILTPQTAVAVCRGRTTLMIAHRLSTARRADIIIVLDKGKVVESGTHDELIGLGLEKGMYAKMWRDQMENSLDDL